MHFFSNNITLPRITLTCRLRFSYLIFLYRILGLPYSTLAKFISPYFLSWQSPDWPELERWKRELVHQLHQSIRLKRSWLDSDEPSSLWGSRVSWDNMSSWEEESVTIEDQVDTIVKPFIRLSNHTPTSLSIRKPTRLSIHTSTCTYPSIHVPVYLSTPSSYLCPSRKRASLSLY